MPRDWPVEVNQLEAAAFCRWKADQTGLPVQLPSEGSGCCCGNNWPAISRTGWRPRQHQPGPLRLLLPGGCLPPGAASSIWWATSGSGPAPPSTASRGSRCTPSTTTSPTPHLRRQSTPHQGRELDQHRQRGACRPPAAPSVATSSSTRASATWSHAIRARHREPYETDTWSPSISTSSTVRATSGRQLRRGLWPVLPASSAAAMSGRSTSAAPPAGPASNWLAASPTWTGWTTRPASSTWP